MKCQGLGALSGMLRGVLLGSTLWDKPKHTARVLNRTCAPGTWPRRRYDLMLRLQHGIRWSIGRGSYIADQTGRGGGGTVGGPGSGPSSTVGSVPAPRLSSLGAGPGGVVLPLSHVLQPGDFTHKDKVFFPAAGS